MKARKWDQVTTEGQLVTVADSDTLNEWMDGRLNDLVPTQLIMITTILFTFVRWYILDCQLT